MKNSTSISKVDSQEISLDLSDEPVTLTKSMLKDKAEQRKYFSINASHLEQPEYVKKQKSNESLDTSSQIKRSKRRAPQNHNDMQIKSDISDLSNYFSTNNP